MFKKSVAAREKVKLMIGLTGPSGSGKTYSALQLASGITGGDWSKITLADTENRSALYYAGEPLTGPWEHVEFDAPYTPERWLKLIDFCEADKKCEVLILDSISHEWQGVGGCLDLQSKLGGRFQDWAKVTPLHNAFIDKMRHSRLHIIATMRSASDYVVEQTDRGKAQPRKVGLKSNQREGMDYEFGIIFDIDIAHFAQSSKDRTGLFAGRGPFQIASDTGKELLAWANSGEASKAMEDPPNTYRKVNTDMQKRLEAYLEKQNVPKDLWTIVEDQLEGHPASEVTRIIELVRNDFGLPTT